MLAGRARVRQHGGARPDVAVGVGGAGGGVAVTVCAAAGDAGTGLREVASLAAEDGLRRAFEIPFAGGTGPGEGRGVRVTQELSTFPRAARRTETTRFKLGGRRVARTRASPARTRPMARKTRPRAPRPPLSTVIALGDGEEDRR